ncbi:MAG TPA: DUF4349 domain-containing protein [Gaiellaceae bacterium]|jgi:hypothetical protein|nr:DUF4349 domain-containing protein [Gaiellaceae bacterium]
MSQLDLIAQLREARPVAPAELREHVRAIAAEAAAAPRRRVTWRRALVVAVPLAAAVAGAAILLPGGSRNAAPPLTLSPPPVVHRPAFVAASPAQKAAVPATLNTVGTATGADQASVPGPSPNRVQRIKTALELRVPDSQAVSDGTKKAVAIAHALGGYPSSLNVQAATRTGYADLTLRIPKQNVQRAVTRLSALGTIVGENVAIKDITVQVDATARKIARLETRLTYWQEQPASDEAAGHVAALTSQIAKLKRGRASTIHAASYATVNLELTTRPAPAPAAATGPGPLHGLGVAFHWLWIGAVYALALGGPLLLLFGLAWLAARAVRRHRENQLLGES